MDLIKSLLGELTYLIGSLIVFISLWSIAGFMYGIFFLGCVLMIISVYLSSVMNDEKA